MMPMPLLRHDAHARHRRVAFKFFVLIMLLSIRTFCRNLCFLASWLLVVAKLWRIFELRCGALVMENDHSTLRATSVL